MEWRYDDGGRRAAGFTGHAGDCVCRAIAIAMQLPYTEVYVALNAHAEAYERPGAWTGRRRRRTRSTARTGMYGPTVKAFLKRQGWRWVATMRIGSGCRVHLRPEELPTGRVLVQTSKHVVAVVDGIIRDTHDPSRGGTRCVYGIWLPPTAPRWLPWEQSTLNQGGSR